MKRVKSHQIARNRTSHHVGFVHQTPRDIVNQAHGETAAEFFMVGTGLLTGKYVQDSLCFVVFTFFCRFLDIGRFTR